MQEIHSTRVAKNTGRRVKASTTLNRRYVKRPVKSTDVMVKVNKTTRSPKIQHFANSAPKTVSRMTVADKNDLAPAQAHPMQINARNRMQVRQQKMQQPQVSKMTAKELKDQAIKKALASAEKAPTMAEQAMEKSPKKTGKIRFGVGRVVLALSCAAAAVFAIAYFVNLNMPDISLRVAAMQTGINASYPNYIPRDFRLSGITSEESKITLNFTNSSSDQSFSLTEEKSPWDSNALLNNYVKEVYSESYSVIREQGLTIYISGSNAAWVNGGIVYKLSAEANTLTNRQICSIAVSL